MTVIGKAAPKTWLVRPNQTVNAKMASEFKEAGVTPNQTETSEYIEALKALNPRLNVNLIYAGKPLKLPTIEKAKAAPAVAARGPLFDLPFSQEHLVRTLSKALKAAAEAISTSQVIVPKDAAAYANTISEVVALAPELKIALARFDPEAFARMGRVRTAPLVELYLRKPELAPSYD